MVYSLWLYLPSARPEQEALFMVLEIVCAAAVAELVDAHVSGACILTSVGVRLPPAAHFFSIDTERLNPERNALERL